MNIARPYTPHIEMWGYKAGVPVGTRFTDPILAQIQNEPQRGVRFVARQFIAGYCAAYQSERIREADGTDSGAFFDFRIAINLVVPSVSRTTLASCTS